LSLPIESVCPATSIWIVGLSLKIFEASATLVLPSGVSVALLKSKLGPAISAIFVLFAGDGGGGRVVAQSI
jgi:hypothetical protein